MGDITREEHDEYSKRMEDEHRRINHRIELLEKNVQQIGTLITSVEKMALSLQSMVKEQEQQGKRLEALESRDGEMWRKTTSYIATTIISVIIGFLFAHIGM